MQLTIFKNGIVLSQRKIIKDMQRDLIIIS